LGELKTWKDQKSVLFKKPCGKSDQKYEEKRKVPIIRIISAEMGRENAGSSDVPHVSRFVQKE
jgi:hypothetical protein